MAHYTYFTHVSNDFIALMNEIGHHGFTKHGDNTFQARILAGENLRGSDPNDRLSKKNNMLHVIEHTEAYYKNEAHDHFHDAEHQLAAIAYNAMMEFICLQQEREKECTKPK